MVHVLASDEPRAKFQTEVCLFRDDSPGCRSLLPLAAVRELPNACFELNDGGHMWKPTEFIPDGPCSTPTPTVSHFSPSLGTPRSGCRAATGDNDLFSCCRNEFGASHCPAVPLSPFSLSHSTKESIDSRCL